ncbi:hypothetical protein BLGI_1395 [Brevibacillus laterosporus GI-9]|nr:hypothetical protein BLGI_1395 [Brevibacillus laterosporus GI-9]
MIKKSRNRQGREENKWFTLPQMNPKIGYHTSNSHGKRMK